ncbi:winged helix-turn-helix domain-containing protein [Pantoea rwandensis]|uniref:OmpR/PhoB-type domain-containing protein n=1 Tax=Pantoea rwandensis TaxID=1076550 RepID=A0A1X1CX88_9GAMM|nr:winged helix-turn-helix domain-containing protein [Pantoea rwandensis]ORM68944.1 hypothetical protein HA51_13265 [Pantoea rwandensis]
MLFFTDSGLIRLGDKEVLLSRQSKICLTFLCEHAGEIISKERLQDACWKQYGTVVSENTVRQTLFRLRKSLASLGVVEEILETQGYAGYRLKPDYINVVPDTHEFLMIEQRSAFETVKEEDHPNTYPLQHSPIAVKQKASQPKLIIFVLFLFCLFFATGAYLRSQQFIHPLHYSEAVNQDGRIFYISNYVENNNAELMSRVNYWLIKMKIQTTQNSKIYINSDHGNSINLFICNGDIEAETSDCESMAVIGRNHP